MSSLEWFGTLERFVGHVRASVRITRAAWACLVVASVTGCGDHQSQASPRFHLPSALVRNAQRVGLSDHEPVALLNACAKLTAWSRHQRVQRPVICPPLAPRGALRRPAQLGGEGNVTTVDLRSGYGVQLFSVQLPDSNGGHWNFAAGTSRALRLNLFPPPPETPPGSRAPSPVHPVNTRLVMLAGLPANVYVMPSYSAGGGIDAGHVVIAWGEDGVAYQLSLHGSSNELRARLMATAWILTIRARSRTRAIVAGPGQRAQTSPCRQSPPVLRNQLLRSSVVGRLCGCELRASAMQAAIR